MKRALITGSARRIGKDIALHLSSKGYGVIIHYLTSEHDAVQTRELCLRAGAAQACIVKADLSDKVQRRGLIQEASAKFGPIDLLVNSASMFRYDTASTYTHETFESHLQTNYLAPVELTMEMCRVTREVSPDARANVITLLDQKLANLNTDHYSYTLSKLASQSSIRYLAQCCAPALRVNAISPGVTMLSGEMTEVEFAKAHQIAALGRSSRSEDIAAMVAILDQSEMVTGQTIYVDGGQHLIPRARDVAFDEQI